MRSSGFTLIEVMIALAISGLVLVTAAGMFTGVGDGARELRRARATLDREANARRWLAATFLSLDVGQRPGGSFEGRPDRVTFGAFEQAPGGWFEERRIVLGRDDTRLVATVQPGEPIALTDGISDVALDYLLEPSFNATWVREWISPVSAPLAIRIRIERGAAKVDTLLFLIKERG